tara:strand:+ start:2275 stop:2790 length:516 start_codon:yes stop_codon:yes gene_type:complete
MTSTPTRLIWCHGSLSEPWGAKSTAFAETAKSMGYTLEAPDFSDLENPDDRVQRLADILSDAKGPTVLLGSSMGGYVATAVAKQVQVDGLFLLAPAFYLKGYDVHVFSGLPESITVIHGWQDDVVPVDNSIRFAKLHRAALHALPDDHRLSASIDTMTSLLAHYLQSFPAP